MPESCGPAVADRCRTGVGSMLQASGRFRPGCDALRHTHWDKEANDVTLWTALVTWYFWRHVMLTSPHEVRLGLYSAGRTGCPTAGFCGVPGLRDSSFRFFPIALRLDGHHDSSSAELPVRFRGDTINIHVWSRGSRDPRDLAVGFLAAQLTGAQNNLLEYIACNIYVYVYIYLYVCVCIYICEYMYMCVCKYIYMYMCK